MRIRAAFACAQLAVAAVALAATPTPYAGQEGRNVKALSPAEISDLLAGRGMGLAKAAELNGYPGPAHVLEHAQELGLSPDQRARTEATFRAMEAKAKDLGGRIVEEERALDALFAAKHATPGEVGAITTKIGALQGELRALHLAAHLEQARILTPAQTAQYAKLRGYATAATGSAHSHRH